VPVEVGTVTVEANAIGTLRANESVTLRPEIPGRILDIRFKEGQAVREGDELITLDPAEYQARLAESAASTKLNQLNYERAREMLKKRLVSQQEYDEAFARLQESQARQALDQVRLDKTQLRAPFGGVLGLRKVSPGDYVQTGQDIVNLEAIDTIKLDFRIPEIYLARVKPGQEVKVQVDAFPDQSFSGEVYAIDPSIDEETRTIQLRARVPNLARTLRPGMFARAALVLERREDAILVPEQAIVPMGANKFVFRVENGRAALTQVELGQRREGKVEVRQGLDRDDVVITAGQMPKVRDGTPVTVIAGSASRPGRPGKEPARSGS
jgi:membrane fusion protein (multidrug efflux system)